MLFQSRLLPRQTRWCQTFIQKRITEEYTARARREGYRARSAYKLMQMDDKFSLFSKKTNCVVDLGCCPGSWLQVASEKMKLPRKGKYLIGIDLLPVTPIAGAEIMRGDFTDPVLQYELLDMVHEAGKELGAGRGMTPAESDRYNISYLGAELAPTQTGDMGIYFQGRKSKAVREITEAVEANAGKRALPPAAVDGVMCDMAPENTTDEASKLVQNHLVELAKGFSIKVLKKGGWFVTKVFQSKDSPDIVRSLNLYFEKVDVSRPPAVQKESREAFIICRGFIGRARVLEKQYNGSAPVIPGIEESKYSEMLDNFNPNNTNYIKSESEVKKIPKYRNRILPTQRLRKTIPSLQLGLGSQDFKNIKMLTQVPSTKMG
eukprot:TRINITY_DN30954_c0_g1_i1.p1 TRINITY_DN30954_c0_g1~~TRINITY_DN30954_c0_g1_i1.p1  ORF type:complete len:388 (+),score=32.92 TRINITY_DN30954_c0_g1_i1:37-1164(+)